MYSYIRKPQRTIYYQKKMRRSKEESEVSPTQFQTIIPECITQDIHSEESHEAIETNYAEEVFYHAPISSQTNFQ